MSTIEGELAVANLPPVSTCRYFTCGSPPRDALDRSVSRVAPSGVEGAPNSEHRAPDRVAQNAGVVLQAEMPVTRRRRGDVHRPLASTVDTLSAVVGLKPWR